MVNAYSFGQITIGDQNYTSDIILFPDRIFSPWWRKEGHNLCLEDLAEIPFENYDVLIVGTGFFGMMKVSSDVRIFMKEKKIQLLIQKTKDAIHKYNEIAQQKRVVGVFHLTC
jgi:hypothetical protein